MLLFNPNAINSLLLFILLFSMLWYFVARSAKSREVVFLIVFIIQLVLWQLCFLIRNVYFDPTAAYPLHYFLNSGYTVFSYLALAMFSYYFITPVFKKESQVVFFSGLAASAAILAYSVIGVFPGGTETFYDPILHVYEAKPTAHRKIILFGLFLLILITAKNLIYKILAFRGEHRTFTLKISITLILGISAVVGVSLLQQYHPIHPHIHHAINTYLSGFLFIYFYHNYLGYSKIRFLYADKTILMIMFTVIIIASITMTISLVFHERGYIENRRAMAERVARDIVTSDQETAALSSRLKRLYGDQAGYIRLLDNRGQTVHSYFGRYPAFNRKTAAGPGAESSEASSDSASPTFRIENGVFYYNFEVPAGTGFLDVGIPYLDYRQHIHAFARVGCFTMLAFIGILLFSLRFVIFVGLTRPLKQLLSGIGEIRGGNLNHRIDVTAQDEIGYIARQFNLMVDDLRISADTIRKSEYQFRELTGMLPDIVYETDLDLKVTYLNQAGFEITGFRPEDIQSGLSLSDIIDEEAFQRLQKRLAGSDSEDAQRIITHPIKSKNGERLSGENNAAIIYDDHLPVGLRGIIRDVTEKIRTENSLIQAQKMEIIGTLAGGIAHDFNNILTGITGTVSILQFKAEKTGVLTAEEVKDNLSILNKSAARATDIVKQLLTLSRHQKPVLKRIDLNTAAKNVYDICKNSFDKKIELKFSCPDEGTFAFADETQMGQALLNLCLNAQDAMTIMRPEGESHSGTLSVDIERLPANRIPRSVIPEPPDMSYCRMRIRDTGVGMDPETISRVFDPFFTKKPKDKGTGLGLAMVYNILKQHNGFVDIHSRISAGTTVDLYIPADDAAPVDTDCQTEDTRFCKFSGTVLIIDDDPVIHDTGGVMLRTLGCSVIHAGDGREGAATYRARKDEIDAVILDVEMPVMSGNETFDALKTIHPEIRVLVWSGFREDPRIDEMLQKGAQGFIQKPYTMKTLSEAVSRVMPHA